jgi:hypothetical protein
MPKRIGVAAMLALTMWLCFLFCRVSQFSTYFVGGEDWGFSVWAHNACHGNSLSSTKLTTLYQLVDKTTGALLKWGISSNPARRYTTTFLASINAKRVDILTGSRRQIAQIERSATSQSPGFFNFEAWAGSMYPR